MERFRFAESRSTRGVLSCTMHLPSAFAQTSASGVWLQQIGAHPFQNCHAKFVVLRDSWLGPELLVGSLPTGLLPWVSHLIVA